MSTERVDLLRSVRWSSPGAFVRDRVEREPGDLGRSAVVPLIGKAAAVFGGSGVLIETPDVATAGIPSELDTFAASRELPRTPNPRTADFVRSRWFDDAEQPRSLAIARDRKGRLVGFAVYGPDPEPPEGVLSTRGAVMDLMAVDRRSTTRLLRHVWRELRARGFDVVGFEHLDPRVWARRAHLRAGFLPVEAGRSVGLEAAEGEDAEPAVWYLTWGDIRANR